MYVIAKCARFLHALRILRSHEMPLPCSARDIPVNSTSQANIRRRCLVGSANSAQRNRVEARQAIKYGYCAHSTQL